MLSPTIIYRYGIAATYDHISSLDDLFCGGEHDPYLNALDYSASVRRSGEPVEVAFAIGPRNATGRTTLVTQVQVFKNRMGHQRYLQDKITIFDTKE